MSPYDYLGDYWRTKVMYLTNGSKVAACIETKEPNKTILFVDDEEIPVNFSDIESALVYADELCSN